MKQQAAPTSLSELVAEQHAVLGRLEALSRRQSDLVQDGEGEELLELLRSRQPLVDRLQEIDRLLPSTRDRWEDAREALPIDARERLDAMAAEVAYLTAEIARRDEVDSRHLADRRDAIAAELAGLSRARTAASAYGPANTTARFQDRRA